MVEQSGFDAIRLPRDDAGPVFEQPWQAHAFSLTLQLHKTGLFTWAEWVKVFSEEIKAAPQLPDESVNDAYYRQWMAALEKIIAAEGLTGKDQISARADEWRQAYINTPHGHPVALANAACPPTHHHDHTVARSPVTVSPAALN
ncbi:nitrile hydratase accessory protein [Mesorhizobium sp. Cs1330R2N1]|uniref:Nitrile hydratase accessory protein n=2 Tax=Mesorhizobium argentiipisi TaxID=3015175 RepID=A0ABU8KLU5_9HYPH